MRPAWLGLAIVAAVGCSKRTDGGTAPKASKTSNQQGAASNADADKDDAEQPAAGRVENGFFIADAAPPPQACTSADDCKGDTVLDASGCCNEPTRVVPHSKAYDAWATKWRQEHCAGHQCPPPPRPAEPDDCLFEVDCVEGKCVNSCGSSSTASTRIEVVDRLLALRGLDRAQLLHELGADEKDIESGYAYERLENLDRLRHPEGWPANFFFQDDALVVIYSSDTTFLAEVTAEALRKALGEPPLTLRSRGGKTAKHVVYPDQGIAFSYQDQSAPVQFLELFPPTDAADYQKSIYREVGPYTR